MPRNGSGVYSKTAGGTAVSGQTISSVDYNAQWDDIVADLNAARPVVAGGTGATTAAGARTALGLEIGTNVQAYSAALTSVAALSTAANKMPYTTGANTYATTDLTAFARTLLDDADAATARATLGAAPLASPALTGTPTAPTQTAGDDSTKVATTAFVAGATKWVYINGGWWTTPSFDTINLTLSNVYECFFFSIESAVPSVNGASFELQMSADGGSTFYTGASDYSWAYDGESGTRFADQDNADSAARITALVGNVKGMSASGFIYPASDANFQTSVHGHMTRVDSTGVYGAGRFSCALNQTVAINFMQLMFDSGTIDKCKWSLWGMKA